MRPSPRDDFTGGVAGQFPQPTGSLSTVFHLIAISVEDFKHLLLILILNVCSLRFTHDDSFWFQ